MSLGTGLVDKFMLAVFGFIAPKMNNSPECKWRKMSGFIPKIWLKPKKLNGLRFCIDPADWSQTVIFDEIFLQSSYDLRRLAFVPSVIIDCGAHIGLFTLLAKATFPNAKLTVYEPNPQNAEFVRRQISRNKLEVTFNEAAISTEEKELNFAVVNSHGGRLQGHGTDGVNVKDVPTYKVKVVDFSVELKKMRPESLLIKMDVEGEEFRILPAILTLLPIQTAIFFETHAGENGWREIEALLTANRFYVEKISSRGTYYDGFACRGSGQAPHSI